MIDDSALMDPELLPKHVWKILESAGISRNTKQKQNSINSFLKSAVQAAFEIALQTGSSRIKFNANCKEEEKIGSGPGSCGGKQSKGSFEVSKKSEQLLKKYKAKSELKKAKTSIMASLVKSTSDEKSALENAKINASIFKGMTAEEAAELTGDAAQEHTNWLMDKGAYYDIKQGISEPMLEDTEELHRRGWNVNGTYHPDIPARKELTKIADKLISHDGKLDHYGVVATCLKEYTGEMYEKYNEGLKSDNGFEVQARILKEALNNVPLEQDLISYRGIRESTLDRLSEIGADKPGAEFRIDGFQSTTLNYETTKAFMGRDKEGKSLRIELHLPRGTPAAYVDDLSMNKGEDEVLVNTEVNFRCVDVKETDATKTLIWEALL